MRHPGFPPEGMHAFVHKVQLILILKAMRETSSHAKAAEKLGYTTGHFVHLRQKFNLHREEVFKVMSEMYGRTEVHILERWPDGNTDGTGAVFIPDDCSETGGRPGTGERLDTNDAF